MALNSVAVYGCKGTATTVICSASCDTVTQGLPGKLREVCSELVRTADRAQASLRSNICIVIEEGQHVIYAHSKGNGLVTLAITDKEYQQRVVISLCSQVMKEFSMKFAGKWEAAEKAPDNFLDWPELARTLAKYQDPAEAGQTAERSTDEIALFRLADIEQLLERQGKIDDLKRRSEELSAECEPFPAPKPRSTCVVM